MNSVVGTFLDDLDLPARRWRDEAREERGRYWTGPGRDGLEVAFTTLPAKPTATEVRKLWSERHGRRAAPLLLVAEHAGQAWLCGPLGEAPTVVVRDLSQAERLAAAALAEPSRHFAVQFLTRAMDTDPDDVPGLVNRGLLASHELKVGVPGRPDWPAAVERGQPLLGKSSRGLVEALGFDVEDRPKHAVLRVRTNGNARAVAVFLNETEQPDAPSARYDRQTPVTFALNQADKAGLPYVLAVRGSNLRLYSTSTSGAVGQRGRTETFVGLDLPLLPTDRAGYLPLLFSAEALAEGGTFGEVAEASASFAVDLSVRLRERVYTQVIPRLAKAIANRAGAATETKADLDEHYRVAVTVLFRLLFIAYAEDSRLLPANHPAYVPHSLKALARSQADAINANRDLGFDNPLTEQLEPDTDTSSTDLWDTCRNLFIAVDQGRPAWGVPVYNGGLFSTDPTVNPVGPIIDRLRLTNAEVGPALVALLVDRTPDSSVGPIDFRSLSVREFGTIYEGLLESELARADTDLTLTRDSKRGDVYTPADDGDDVVVEAGGVYLHNKSGARKATGSYFTKPFAVQHLIDTAVLPTLDEHLQRVEAVLDAGDEVGASELLFDFRVADIAMGSGHFLTAVVDALEARYATFLADQPIPHVTAMLETLRRAAHNNLGDLGETVDIETSALLRRLIARRCVYGVDINPISVELARVAMWIHTFVPGLPLSFLDHNLVVGDSLTGIGTVDEAMDELTETGAQVGLFDDPVREALKAAEEPLRRLSSTVDATSEDIAAARQAADDARKAVQPVADLLDLLVAHRLGKVEKPNITALEDLPYFYVATARQTVAELNAVHFPIAFPEVFIRERPGFDALVGNPPWETVKAERQKYWALRFPGLMALRGPKQTQEMRRLEMSHPEIVAEYEQYRWRVEEVRNVLMASPYPGTGSGDPDLSEFFAWRFTRLLREGGRFGIALPRSIMMSSGTSEWRSHVFETCTIEELATLVNNRLWVFDIHPQYTVALLTLAARSGSGVLTMRGPFRSLEDWKRRHEAEPVSIDVRQLKVTTPGCAVPFLPSEQAAEVFQLFVQHPPWSSSAQRWEATSYNELHSTNDKEERGGVIVMESHVPAGGIPVYKGESFALWEPDTGRYYGWAEREEVESYLQQRRLRQVRNRRSPFYGESEAWALDLASLPFKEARIAWRKVARATDTRSFYACLIPPDAVSTEHNYLIRIRSPKPERDSAYLLGCMCSIPFDWFARLWVEANFTGEIVRPFPVPNVDPEHAGHRAIVEISGRLAAVDERYSRWAAVVGVPVGSVTSEAEKDSLIAELDACVARLYGLTEAGLTHVFETFHVGWDYRPRLERVLGHFRQLDFDPAPTDDGGAA